MAKFVGPCESGNGYDKLTCCSILCVCVLKLKDTMSTGCLQYWSHDLPCLF